MGNSSSSSQSTGTPRAQTVDSVSATVDQGTIEPQSHLYATSYLEYSRPVVHRLIQERKLAPFYLGIDDFEQSWTPEQVAEALEEAEAQATKNLQDALALANAAASDLADSEAAASATPQKKSKEVLQAQAQAGLHRERLLEVLKIRESYRARGFGVDKREIAGLYVQRAVECPICFLYYPPPLVHTRCCDQPICTECFVQIKRIDPTTTHLESEPAACPFCMEENFGCIYTRPRDEMPTRPAPQSITGDRVSDINTSPPVMLKQKARRKSFAHTEKQVVTTDQVHPDWQAKLDTIRATVARRANRRIVFRQIGDRLIPVGISSARTGEGSTLATGALPPGFASRIAAAMDSNAPSATSDDAGTGLSTRESRRAARRRNEEMATFLSSMGLGVGQELEDMMVMEAIRLSMVDDEQRKQKALEEEAKASAAAASVSGDNAIAGETSEQGASGEAEDDIPIPRTPNTTISMLSEAMMDPTPAASTSTLPYSLPAVSIPSPSSSPSTYSRHLSTPSPSSTPSRHRSNSSISNLISSSLAAASIGTPTPNSASLDTTGASQLARGIVGAGVNATASTRPSTITPTESAPRNGDAQREVAEGGSNKRGGEEAR